jgi:DNA polymerase III delta prime subunit
MPQPAWLVYGPPGCGKTTWILSQAKQAKQKIYHWNARTDRTLREGRETLHRQVRSQDPLFVWIEGAEDLTPEAQAFLRRILETVSAPVQCILECRDPQRITPAIQSRCEWKQATSMTSYRKKQQLEKVGVKEVLEETNCRNGFLKAENPILAIQKFIDGPLWKEALLALKQVGNGSSAWAQLFYLRSLCADSTGINHPQKT